MLVSNRLHRCCGDDYADTLDVLKNLCQPAEASWEQLALELRCQHNTIDVVVEVDN